MELYAMLVLLGAVVIYFTYKQAIDKGITTAVLLHREGRLTYKDYYDDEGNRMVDIDIKPIGNEKQKTSNKK
jgi:hypothetical protein|tara:strand:- start:804 stop:1019 length:216 start_codon:yes stop_codon:yes gene_type:complete